ncbi:MAG: D-aminoacyl-tRNA deacylase, partial [Deltaproteobacteria bacterium]|nr:D-aminoacyl-tRNA deacylase [Deltaproteobacteria bacterium]
MRAVIERVSSASVPVDGEVKGEIGRGLLALIGVEKGDTDKDMTYISAKITNLRIFYDEAGKMNLSVKDITNAESGAQSNTEGVA